MGAEKSSQISKFFYPKSSQEAVDIIQETLMMVPVDRMNMGSDMADTDLKGNQIFLILQQQDLSRTVFLKMSSTSSSFWWRRKGLLPLMKLSISTTLHCPNLYLPSHSTSVSSLYRDSKWGGATISFSITTKCSQVFNSSGTGSSGTDKRIGVFTNTNIRMSIFSYPLQTVLLEAGSEKRQLSWVRQSGVQVIRPKSLSQAQRWYWDGDQFQLRTIESPLTITASTIRQLSCISSPNFLSSAIFTLQPFSVATSRDCIILSLSPAQRYQSMKLVLRSTMAQSEALYILSKQSVIVVGWMRQQLITLSGIQPQDSWQVLRLMPHNVKGSSTFFANSTLNSSCFFLSLQMRSFSSSLTTSRSITRSTECTPASGSRGFFIYGMISSRSLPLLLIFSSSLCLLKLQVFLRVTTRGSLLVLLKGRRSDSSFLLIIENYNAIEQS